VAIAPITSYTTTRFYTGEVVATRRSELGFERSGTLDQIQFDRGEAVKRGQAIARLDTRNLQAQLQQLQAQRTGALAQLQELQRGPRREAIAAAQAQVGNLENLLRLEELRSQRRQSLYQEGAIAREQFEEVAINRDALADRLAAARSQLAELQNGTRQEQITAQQATVQQIEASIRDLEVTIAKSTLYAPFDGVIGDRFLDEGAVAQAGQAIVRLVEAATPEVEIGVPPVVARSLSPGRRQQVRIGERPYGATVLAVKPETSAQNRTRTVVLSLEPVAKQPAPGEIARLEIQQQVATNGFWLPTTALVRGERGLWSCYALQVDGEIYRVERRDVEVLHTEGDRVLVRGTLTAGDRIVRAGVQRIVPGQVVNLLQS